MNALVEGKGSGTYHILISTWQVSFDFLELETTGKSTNILLSQYPKGNLNRSKPNKKPAFVLRSL